MATFTYRCADCGRNVPVAAPVGAAPQFATCQCGGKASRVYGSFNIGAGALPNKKGHVMARAKSEDRLENDRSAYKRMRRQGLQPRMLDGSKELEGASSQFEVEYGKLFPKKEDQKKIKEGMDRSAEIREIGGLSGEQVWKRPAGRS